MTVDNWWPDLLAKEAESLPITLDHHKIIELWYSGRASQEQKDDLAEKIGQAVITGELKGSILWRNPATGVNTDLPENRWQDIRGGVYNRGFVSYRIHGRDFADWLEKVGDCPDDSLLKQWWGPPPLAVVLQEVPDYGTWMQYEGFAPLNEAICFALGVHPQNRAKWLPVKRESYDKLLSLAQAAILTGALKAREMEGIWYVDKFSFYEWVTKQGEQLSGTFLACSPIVQTDTDEGADIITLQEPKNKDDWFYVIRDAVAEYEHENQRTPSATKLWMRLIDSPPEDYGVTFNSKKKYLNMPDGETLDRETFNKRFKRYYPAN